MFAYLVIPSACEVWVVELQVIFFYYFGMVYLSPRMGWGGGEEEASLCREICSSVYTEKL